MDLISVIIPVYNVENLLDRCLESVVNQTYTNLQIILVNDGSTDNSLSVCKKWKAKDRRIVLINKENGGASSARNAGLDAATGDWIGFIDSDDQIDLNFYEELLACAKKTASHVAAGAILSKRESGEVFDPYKSDYTFSETYPSNKFLHMLYINDKTNGCIVGVYNKIYKSELWNGAEKFRFINNRFYEDDEVASRLYLKNFTVAITNKIAYYYIKNPTSQVNSSYNPKKWLGLKTFYERILVFENLDEQLYTNAIEMFIDLYLEHYYKMKDLNIKIDKMRELFLDALKRYKKTHKFSKTTIRYDLFKISPKLYSIVCRFIG